MSHARRLLSATKRNATNLLTATQAESILVANGWVLGANATLGAGAVPGPFGFGVGSTYASTAGGLRSLRFVSGTFGTAGCRGAVYVRVNTVTNLIVGVSDETNAVLHYVNFLWSGTSWSIQTTVGGATGRVCPYTFDNGWVRLEFEFALGVTGTGATASGSSKAIYMTHAANGMSVDVWGAYFEAISTFDTATGDASTRAFTLAAGAAFDNWEDLLITVGGVLQSNTTYRIDQQARTVTFDTAPANLAAITFIAGLLSVVPPYMTGVESGLRRNEDVRQSTALAGDKRTFFTGQELPFFRPQRVKDENGVFYTEWLNTPSGAMKLQGRSAPDAPWTDLVSITQANLNGTGQYAILVSLMPEMQLVIPTIGNSTVTFTAWILE